MNGFSNRHRIGMIAVFAAVSLILVGCSSGSPAAEKVSVAFWNGLTGSDKPAVDAMVSAFNASQSRITVVNNAMPWDTLKQKALSSIAANAGPSVLSIDVNEIGQYVDAGAIQPLGDFYGKGKLDDKNLVKSAVDATAVKGSKYGIPMTYFTIMLYWNKDLFARAGYDHPPATWDEFKEMASKLTVYKTGSSKPDQYAIALADHDGTQAFQSLLWNSGGGVFSADGTRTTLDDPATLAGLNFWIGLVRNQHISPIGLTGADADALFQSGKAAMLFEGPWVAPTFKNAGINFGVARTPKGPAGQYTLAGSIAFGVPSNINSQVKQAVYEFAAFWNGRSKQATYVSSTGFPSTRSDLGPADFGSNPFPGIFGDPAVTSASRMYTAGVRNGTKIDTTVFVPALQKALNGAGSVDDLFRQAQQDAMAVKNSS
jgi:multiple sugar transport system substrate-binding protein